MIVCLDNYLTYAWKDHLFVEIIKFMRPLDCSLLSLTLPFSCQIFFHMRSSRRLFFRFNHLSLRNFGDFMSLLLTLTKLFFLFFLLLTRLFRASESKNPSNESRSIWFGGLFNLVMLFHRGITARDLNFLNISFVLESASVLTKVHRWCFLIFIEWLFLILICF